MGDGGLDDAIRRAQQQAAAAQQRQAAADNDAAEAVRRNRAHYERVIEAAAAFPKRAKQAKRPTTKQEVTVTESSRRLFGSGKTQTRKQRIECWVISICSSDGREAPNPGWYITSATCSVTRSGVNGPGCRT
jgi:hypothetical protein